MGTTITALPVVLPLGALASILLLRRLEQRGLLTPARALLVLVVVVYAAGVVANSFFPIRFDRGVERPPWTVFVNLVPLRGTEPADMAQNVVVFLPLGVLVPLLHRGAGVLRALLVGFLLSLGIETVQLLNAVTGHGGHIADVDDLLSNTVGAPLGYAAFRVAVLVPALARCAAAVRTPEPAQD